MGKKSTKKTARMSDADILALVSARKGASIGSGTGGTRLSARRENNLKRYLGEPYGDERTGQSKVVTRQCMEAVEWSLPSLIRIFASTEEVAKFKPIGPEDVQQAKQESQYLNHVISIENDGFVTNYTFIKSVLMNPVAYAKAYPVEDEIATVESYEAVLPEALAELMKDRELEPIEQEETVCDVNFQGQLMQVPAFNVKFRRVQKYTRIAIEPVPPEELRIASGWGKVSLDGVPYICHSTTKTRSELISQGYPKSLVESLPKAGGGVEDSETDDRDNVTDNGNYGADSTFADASTDDVEIDEHYLWIDVDGDGVSEYRMITTSGQEILENEETDDHPFVAGCAVPVPFAHVGLAWQELVEDIQRIQTTVTRQYLNNLYRMNNPRTVVGRGVNLSDVINDLPNSPIRAKDVNQIRMEPTMPIAQNVLPMFEVLDKAKEARTGVSRSTMGLDADTLSRVTSGAFYGSLEQANQRLEMLARIIAEFSIKPLYLKVHKLILKHYTSPRQVEMSGVWTQINPSEWRSRKDLHIMVGLGTGNKQAQAMALDKIMTAQEKLKTAGSPMVSDQNIFNSLEKLVSLAEGMPNVDTYFTDPEKAKAMGQQGPPKQDPNAALAAAQMEMAKVEREKVNLRHKEEMMKMQQKMFAEQQKNQTIIDKLILQAQESGVKFELEGRAMDIKEFVAKTSAEIDAAKVLQDEERLTKSLNNAERTM